MTVFICYTVLAYGVADTIYHGIVSPLVLVGVLAYFVGLMFIEIFGMGIETMLFCYIADEEMFGPADRFADGDLKLTIQRTTQTANAVKAMDVKIFPEVSLNLSFLISL